MEGASLKGIVEYEAPDSVPGASTVTVLFPSHTDGCMLQLRIKMLTCGGCLSPPTNNCPSDFRRILSAHLPDARHLLVTSHLDRVAQVRRGAA